ncbi:hypothetical protein SNE40_019758 [Patella caerulea]|uniref:Protein NDNF n=1 Tax=Patella caerulea TaxID=87958 RepID=A0AAN8J7Q5_PATCE
MQLSDRIGYLLAVGNIIVLLLYIPRTLCQHLPSQDEDKFEFDINELDIFYDTHVIPESVSVPVYLYKGKSQNYFFRVEKNNLPLKIILSPCSSSINWSIKRRDILPDIEDDDSNDYEDINDRDPFHAQRSKNQNPLSPYTFLGNFTGKEPTTYYLRRAASGLYMIEILSLNSDTTVDLYGSTTSYPVHLKPSLPNDKSVSITSKSKRMFTFEWKQSSFERGFNDSVEYCVAVNRVKNYKTYCELMAKVLVQRKAKSSGGWGFSWEQTQKRQLDKKGARGKIIYKCIGSKTKYTFNTAKPGKTYHVDVFVLNRKVNTVAAYSGTRVKTERRKKEKRKALLQDGKRKTIKLRKGSSEQNVMFKVESRLDSAVLELKSCRGKIPITIYHGNKNIHQTVVSRMKVLRMKNLPVGVYTVKLTGNKNRKRVLSMLFTTATYKKPRLPYNPEIKVIDSVSTCHSVTLSWSLTSLKQRYCLYVRESPTISNKRSHHCLEMAGRRKKDKVMCVRLKRKDRDKAIFTYIVKSLKSDTDYVFDVYVNRGIGASLAYHSVVTRTKPDCTK